MNVIQNKPNQTQFPQRDTQHAIRRTNPNKANSPAPQRDTTDVASSGYLVYNDM
jgi:hypothetical protein